jgi:hypothetical protein
MKIIRNRMWGFRRSEPQPQGRASGGAAVTIHRGAQRILFENNVIFDCPIAFQEVNRDLEDPNHGEREVTVRSNVVSFICPHNPDDLGAVLRTATAFHFEGNQFSNSHVLSALEKPPPDDDFVGNVLYDTPLGAAPLDWISANRIAERKEMSDVLIMCRRWTHPDLTNLHSAVVRAYPVL